MSIKTIYVCDGCGRQVEDPWGWLSVERVEAKAAPPEELPALVCSLKCAAFTLGLYYPREPEQVLTVTYPVT